MHSCYALDLLNAMGANPNFKMGPTPTLTSNFIFQIESADLAMPDISEDDHYASWGHYQFTSGSMTISSVLKSWDLVGSTATACMLIAATIKTCKVAHHICFEKGIMTTNYLSNAYLANIVESNLWNDVGGVSPISIAFC